MSEEVLVFAGPPETAESLRAIVADTGWQVLQNSDWRLAADLAKHSGATVFIYDRDANPKDWAEALGRVLCASLPTEFLMISRFADDSMWAELLARCGYDLLLHPLNRTEVLRTIDSASGHARCARKKQSVQAVRPPSKPAQRKLRRAAASHAASA